jgi:hypothetical protein
LRQDRSHAYLYRSPPRTRPPAIWLPSCVLLLCRSVSSLDEDPPKPLFNPSNLMRLIGPTIDPPRRSLVLSRARCAHEWPRILQLRALTPSHAFWYVIGVPSASSSCCQHICSTQVLPGRPLNLIHYAAAQIWSLRKRPPAILCSKSGGDPPILIKANVVLQLSGTRRSFGSS